MQSIPIATKQEFNSESATCGRFIIEPFYPGYGLTIGNALRRVLLSSLEGVAITSVRIKGVEHEFSSLDGVKEDVVEIILNLKKVRFEVSGEFEEPIKLELNAKGAKQIKAGDFKKVAGVKTINSDLILATLTDNKSEFNLEVWIEKGRGYLPTEMMQKKEKEIGVINIDAIFSPIRKVSIDTENVRVGEMTNWDRLIIDLETDGSLELEECLKKAANILIEQFSFFLAEHKKDAQTSKDKISQEPAVDSEHNTNKPPDEPDKHTESEENLEDAVQSVENKPRKRGRPKKGE